MDEKTLTYKKYNNTSFLVNGNKEKHHKFMKTLNGRWNSRVKESEPGWTVPIEKEKELKIYIESLNVDNLNKNIKSRKSQNKYHRAISVSSSEDEDEDGNLSVEEDIKHIEPIVEKKIEPIVEKKDKKESCDLLEVYGDADKESLKNIKTVDWSVFMANDSKTIEASDIEFSNDKMEEHQALMDEEFEMSKTSAKKIVIALGEGDDEDVDVDDI
jgi:hypothetical protein